MEMKLTYVPKSERSTKPASAFIKNEEDWKTGKKKMSDCFQTILLEANVFYAEKFLDLDVADSLFTKFQKLDWKLRTYNEQRLNRQTAVYGDKEISMQAPRIWGDDAVINPWTDELFQLKEMVEAATGEKYNICLGNRYLSGKDFIGMHCDNEEYGSTKSIASISLGCSRSFQYRIKKGSEKLDVKLKHGSLLLMADNCQERYLHGMKKESLGVDDPFDGQRINLTFRKFILDSANIASNKTLTEASKEGSDK
jgi:alkylated DNA repair dioxygenase AlkB